MLEDGSDTERDEDKVRTKTTGGFVSSGANVSSSGVAFYLLFSRSAFALFGRIELEVRHSGDISGAIDSSAFV